MIEQYNYTFYISSEQKNTRYCVMHLYSDTRCSQIEFRRNELQSFLVELYFREHRPVTLMLKHFCYIHPLTACYTVIFIVWERYSRISNKKKCHRMMPVLWFLLFFTRANNVRVNVQKEWLFVFVEDKISFYSRLFEDFPSCCLSRVLVCWVDVSSWSKPLLVGRMVDHENFFIFRIYHTPICNHMTYEILARSDVVLGVM